MKKILFYIMLAAPAVCLLSCSSVNKATNLKQDAIGCGGETTVWESLPASDHSTYDVTVSFVKGPCLRRVITQDRTGNLTTNNVTKSKPQTYTAVTKIVLQCLGGDLPIATNCSFTVNDVRKSPTDTTATVTITNQAPVTVTCGTTTVAFTATNTAGADVTILWQSGSPCKATMTAIRAGATAGKTVTNTFFHDTAVDKQLNSIHDVLKISVNCDGISSSSYTDCSFQVVETEYP